MVARDSPLCVIQAAVIKHRPLRRATHQDNGGLQTVGRPPQVRPSPVSLHLHLTSPLRTCFVRFPLTCQQVLKNAVCFIYLFLKALLRQLSGRSDTITSRRVVFLPQFFTDRAEMRDLCEAAPCDASASAAPGSHTGWGRVQLLTSGTIWKEVDSDFVR